MCFNCLHLSVSASKRSNKYSFDKSLFGLNANIKNHHFELFLINALLTDYRYLVC